MPVYLLAITFTLCCSLSAFATEQDEEYEESLNPVLSAPLSSKAHNSIPVEKTLENTKQDVSSAALVTDASIQIESNESIVTLEDNEQKPQVSVTTKTWGEITLLDRILPANSSATLDWYSGHLPGGFAMATPVMVIHGIKAGPTVCLTAAIHGDELNGVEIVRRVMRSLKAEDLKGTIIAVPVVNIDGLWRKDRYMSDRRDLNRAFPGDANGSTASRVAESLFNNIIRHCDSVVDLHSGSMYRENITQLRVDLTIKSVAEITKQFGAISVLQSIAPPGSLRGAATAEGIPAVVMEVGGPFTLDMKLVETGVKALRSYLSSIDMLPSSFFWSSPQPIFYVSHWLRSQQGGILINKVSLGQKVNKGQLLAEISNPINEQVEMLYSPFDAVVLGRAQDQFVSAGYAVFNLGERRKIEDLEQQGEQTKKKVAEKTVRHMGLNKTAKSQTNKPKATEAEKTKLLPEVKPE